ncbi:V-set and immunoglobulin domain-containing protein 1-like isoform X2 [Chelmon rostratus]|uniref:V-set and immunoglobulin domain-containing protein 1-like isoform X2 n=1 Tax=Chelmon rostratus TaxID=109905 RepID=UPI001BE9AAA0|nr:V-set and immunoglobulin domain-containing protein 1-like isoform X2 [Chelmon rostratus]
MFSRRLSLLELLSICFFLLTLAERITGLENGPGVIEVVAKEGDDAVLPCSLSTKQNIVPGLFDWKKDGQKEVFLYDAGIHYSNGRAGQDEQFKGRILHFEEELKHGNASIIIRNTNVADSGDYTCGFPHLQPNGQIFHIKLVVHASPKPCISTLNQTEEMALLQCEVRGASPKPTVEWWDSAGNKLHAEEPQTPSGGDRHYVTLLTTVTTTSRVRCVATQEEIGHQTEAETFVFISGKLCEDLSSKVDIVGWLLAGCVLGAVIVAAAQLVLVATKCITIRRNKGSRLQRDGSSSSDTPDTKAGMLL